MCPSIQAIRQQYIFAFPPATVSVARGCSAPPRLIMRNDVTSMRIFNAGVRIMLSLGCIMLHEYPGPAPPPPTAHQTKLSLVPTFIPLSPLLFQHTIGGSAESLNKFLSKCLITKQDRRRSQQFYRLSVNCPRVPISAMHWHRRWQASAVRCVKSLSLHIPTFGHFSRAAAELVL